MKFVPDFNQFFLLNSEYSMVTDHSAYELKLNSIHKVHGM